MNNYLKILGVALATLWFAGCVNNEGVKPQQGMTREAYLNTLDSTMVASSLVFWTSDTAWQANAELLVLLDKLYQHVTDEVFATDVRVEERWMSEYRTSLCSYYDAHYASTAAMDCYAKADSVLNEGVRLVELDGDWSTAGSMAKLGIESVFNASREYGILSKMLECSEDESTREMVLAEWDLYERMANLMGTVASEYISLNFWGGSIAGPLSINTIVELGDVRRAMYADVNHVLNNEKMQGEGVYLPTARQTLIDCCTRLIADVELFKEQEDERECFEEVRGNAQQAIKELNALIPQWIGVWNQLDEALASDGSRHELELVASELLVGWASIMSSKW